MSLKQRKGGHEFYGIQTEVHGKDQKWEGREQGN